MRLYAPSWMDAGSDRCPIGGVKSAVEEAIWQGGGAGLAGANFRSAEAEGVAGETRRRMSEERSDEFASMQIGRAHV